jgi:hypothetical protein
VLARVAPEVGLVALIRRDQVLEGDDSGRRSSNWVIMARDSRDLGTLPSTDRWQSARGSSTARVWTDDYANVIALLVGR